MGLRETPYTQACLFSSLVLISQGSTVLGQHWESGYHHIFSESRELCREMRTHKDAGEVEVMTLITVYWARINVMSLGALGSYSQGGGCFLLLYSYWTAKGTGSRSQKK